MIKNPLFSAAAAAVYVVAIVAFLTFAGSFMGNSSGSPIVVPMAMLSLLVLSAAVMAFLFFYQPVALLIAGKPQEAFTHLGLTIAWFAAFTVGLVLIALLA